MDALKSPDEIEDDENNSRLPVRIKGTKRGLQEQSMQYRDLTKRRNFSKGKRRRLKRSCFFIMPLPSEAFVCDHLHGSLYMYRTASGRLDVIRRSARHLPQIAGPGDESRRVLRRPSAMPKGKAIVKSPKQKKSSKKVSQAAKKKKYEQGKKSEPKEIPERKKKNEKTSETNRKHSETSGHLVTRGSLPKDNMSDYADRALALRRSSETQEKRRSAKDLDTDYVPSHRRGSTRSESKSSKSESGENITKEPSKTIKDEDSVKKDIRDGQHSGEDPERETGEPLGSHRGEKGASFTDRLRKSSTGRRESMPDSTSRVGSLGDSSARRGSLGDSTSRRISLGDSTSRRGSLGDSSARRGSLGDSSARRGSLGDSSARRGSVGDTSVRRGSLGDSSARRDSLGDSSARRDSLGDSGARGGSLGDRSARRDSLGDSSARRGSSGDSSAKRDSKRDSSTKRGSMRDSSTERGSMRDISTKWGSMSESGSKMGSVIDSSTKRGSMRDSSTKRGSTRDSGAKRGSVRDSSDKRGSVRDSSDKRGSTRDSGATRGSVRDSSTKRGSMRDSSAKRGSVRDSSTKRGSVRDSSDKRGSVRDSSDKRGSKRDSSAKRGSKRDSSDKRGSVRDSNDKMGSKRDSSAKRGSKRDSSDKRGSVRDSNDKINLTEAVQEHTGDAGVADKHKKRIVRRKGSSTVRDYGYFTGVVGEGKESSAVKGEPKAKRMEKVEDVNLDMEDSFVNEEGTGSSTLVRYGSSRLFFHKKPSISSSSSSLSLEKSTETRRRRKKRKRSVLDSQDALGVPSSEGDLDESDSSEDSDLEQELLGKMEEVDKAAKPLNVESITAADDINKEVTRNEPEVTVPQANGEKKGPTKGESGDEARVSFRPSSSDAGVSALPGKDRTKVERSDNLLDRMRRIQTINLMKKTGEWEKIRERCKCFLMKKIVHLAELSHSKDTTVIERESGSFDFEQRKSICTAGMTLHMAHQTNITVIGKSDASKARDNRKLKNTIVINRLPPSHLAKLASGRLSPTPAELMGMFRARANSLNELMKNMGWNSREVDKARRSQTQQDGGEAAGHHLSCYLSRVSLLSPRDTMWQDMLKQILLLNKPLFDRSRRGVEHIHMPLYSDDFGSFELDEMDLTQDIYNLARRQVRKASKRQRRYMWKMCIRLVSIIVSMRRAMSIRSAYFESDNHVYLDIGDSALKVIRDDKGHIVNCELYMASGHCAIHISRDVRRLLETRSSDRSEEDVSTIMFDLQCIPAVCEMPLCIQRAMASVGTYLAVQKGRVILRAGHRPLFFYFIISGQVMVSEFDNADGGEASRYILAQGQTFGDKGLVKGVRRTCTAVSRWDVELLAISKQDYIKIFETSELRVPEYILFLFSLEWMKHWPHEELLANRTFCSFAYHRKGSVIVKDSTDSENIYVVWTGTCEVLMEIDYTEASWRDVELVLAHPTINFDGWPESRTDSDFPGYPARQAPHAIFARQSASLVAMADSAMEPSLGLYQDYPRLVSIFKAKEWPLDFLPRVADTGAYGAKAIPSEEGVVPSGPSGLKKKRIRSAPSAGRFAGKGSPVAKMAASPQTIQSTLRVDSEQAWDAESAGGRRPRIACFDEQLDPIMGILECHVPSSCRGGGVRKTHMQHAAYSHQGAPDCRHASHLGLYDAEESGSSVDQTQGRHERLTLPTFEEKEPRLSPVDRNLTDKNRRSALLDVRRDRKTQDHGSGCGQSEDSCVTRISSSHTQTRLTRSGSSTCSAIASDTSDKAKSSTWERRRRYKIPQTCVPPKPPPEAIRAPPRRTYRVRKPPVMVVVHELHAGEAFGFDQLPLPLIDTRLKGTSPKVTLISGRSSGAEVIGLNKRFFVQHADSRVQRRVEKLITWYPDPEDVRARYRLQLAGELYMDKVRDEFTQSVRSKTKIHGAFFTPGNLIDPRAFVGLIPDTR